ncbi:MAG: lamin tail domain-containing protein [Verrucomicrobiota bacterium]
MYSRIVLLALGLLVSTLSLPAAEIFPLGSSWKFFLGTREASTPNDAWRAIGFNDARWTNAVAPIGLGEADVVTRLPASNMSRFWVAVFFRKSFVLTNPASVSELKLTARIDDGCAVWINGRSAGRFNVPDGDLNIYTPFESSLDDIEPTLTTFTLSEDIRSLLVAGTNVVAVEAFNSGFFSNDFLFDASLEYTVDTTPPHVVDVIPSIGIALPTLNQIEVLFDEDVSGVEAADLLVNGVAATNLTAVSDAQYVFGVASPPAGPVQVTWRPDHGIKDFADPPNAFAGTGWSYTIDPTITPPGVIISEFMADNDKGIHDEDGDDSDWIELYNAGFVTVDLAGWSLSNQAGGANAWRLPSVSLLPQRYLLIFASGKNRTNPAGPLHTNFKLNKDGGYLALANAQGQVVSEFAPRYPAQQTDVSYGRERGNPDKIGYFTTPTPGARNSVNGPNFSGEVHFSVTSRTFTNAFRLELSTPATNATIRYSFGTNLPTELAEAYIAPIEITNSTLVRARAFVPGLLSGPVRTETYLKLAPEMAGFSSDLPLIVLHNFGRGSVPSSTDQSVAVQVFEPKTGISSLSNGPDVASLGILHKRGRSTSGLPKPSFFLEIQDEFGDDRNVSLGGLPSESDWVLYAPNDFDPVLLHNPVAHELMRQMGRYSPRTRFVEVYLQDSSAPGGAITPAEYNGVYVLEEKIKIGPNRVDIDKLQPEHIAPPEVTGGYLLSIDSAPPGTRPFFGAGASINYLDPDYAEITTPQRDAQEKYITGFFDSFGQALEAPNWTNTSDGYAAYIDVPAAIDHHLQGVITFNVDALRLSGYFYKPRNGKLTMGPVWDFDRTQGSADGRDFNPRVWRSSVPDYGTDMFNSDPQIFDNPWYSRMFKDIDFWQKWIDRYQELRRDVLSDTNVSAIIDRQADQVRQAQPREVARWRGSSGSDTSPRNGRKSSGGYTYTFPGTYQGEVDFMKLWYSNRLDFIDGQFVDSPAVDHASGSVSAGTVVTLTGPPGASIYYTLDGRDPRLPGGAVSPQAQVYAEPLTLNGNVRLMARCQDLAHRNQTGSGKPPLSSTWSGLTAATFVVSTPRLVITKIMYDPPPSQPGAGDGASFEYLELRNVGSSPLDLAGFRLTRGVDFQFPELTLAAGERIVVAQNVAAFQARYGTNIPMAGAQHRPVGQRGRTTLKGRWEPILDFTYDNQWFPITQGFGFGLVIRDDTAPLASWGTPANWRISSTRAGSPGADPLPPVFPAVVVNEVLSHTEPPVLDAIELFNPTATAADLTGWFLTDDFNDPFKYRFSAGTTIGPNGYRVLTEEDFKNGALTGFRLSAEGDDVYLFSGDASTNLTGYVDGFSFGPSPNGISFGRYVTSIGEEQFVEQTRLTLGGPNAGPRVGPVVINEVMFHPPAVVGSTNNLRDEFIELRNISSQPVSFFNTNAPDGSWLLAGGVDFTLPLDLTLPADGYLLVVGFDPVASPGELAGFRNQYQLDTNVLIIGPWSGQLQNRGETIRLLQPNPDALADSDAVAPNLESLVETIAYANAAPWPGTANGTGFSLQRIVSAGFGNDPTNWLAAVATPGGPNAAPERDTDGDGMPDSWETAEGLDPTVATGDDGPDADPDGDGFTNLEEYLSGTKPHAAGSHFQIDAVTYDPSGLHLHFATTAGRSYSILTRADLASGNWAKLLDIPAAGASKTIEISLGNPAASDAPAQYYQVVTPAQP